MTPTVEVGSETSYMTALPATSPDVPPGRVPVSDRSVIPPEPQAVRDTMAWRHYGYVTGEVASMLYAELPHGRPDDSTDFRSYLIALRAAYDDDLSWVCVESCHLAGLIPDEDFQRALTLRHVGEA